MTCDCFTMCIHSAWLVGVLPSQNEGKYCTRQNVASQIPFKEEFSLRISEFFLWGNAVNLIWLEFIFAMDKICKMTYINLLSIAVTLSHIN